MSRNLNGNQSESTKPIVPPFPTYYDDFEESRFKRKLREQPLFPIGLTGLTAIVAYNAYNIIKRKKSRYPLSLQVIHTRMYAQGFLAIVLTCGMCYSAGHRFYDLFIKPETEEPLHVPDKER